MALWPLMSVKPWATTTDLGRSMPFKSEAQRRYFEPNKTKLEKQGVDVKEWEQSSKGLKLPERAPKSKVNKSR